MCHAAERATGLRVEAACRKAVSGQTSRRCASELPWPLPWLASVLAIWQLVLPPLLAMLQLVLPSLLAMSQLVLPPLLAMSQLGPLRMLLPLPAMCRLGPRLPLRTSLAKLLQLSWGILQQWGQVMQAHNGQETPRPSAQAPGDARDCHHRPMISGYDQGIPIGQCGSLHQARSNATPSIQSC